MADRYDLIVIGAGPGGYEAAIEAAKSGVKTALIERRELGGTCLNRGCIPTKTLLHTAELYRGVRGASTIGLEAENLRCNMAQLQARKNAVVEQLRGGIASLMKANKVTVIQGSASIVDSGRVRIEPEGTELETEHILIATGSTPVVPPIPGADLPGVVTSDELLDCDALPQSLVIIGGDGSLTGGSLLSKETGLPIVGLPGTIDNDVWGMDYTIGCDTAANTIVDAINKLRDTASAHRRIMLVEVMGRNSGWLAMMSGIAGGAEFVLVPEVKFNIDTMCEEIKEMYDAGKRYSIIVVAEGAGSAIEIGKAVEEKTGIDTRVSVLGHIQRGGSPTVEDRMKASMLGEKAALAIISGASDVVFGFNEGKVVAVNLFEAVNNTKTLNPELVRLARVLA